jgi:uracil-DNA glycosylase
MLKMKVDHASYEARHLRHCLQEPGWVAALADQFEQPYFRRLEERLALEAAEGHAIFPPRHLLFRALNSVPIASIKAVILGQDPYYTRGHADGLAFSVPPGTAAAQSCRNVLVEAGRDVGLGRRNNACLEIWADEGVLLLNTILTVREGKAHSHRSYGWRPFTDAVLRVVREQAPRSAILLWGGPARKRAGIFAGSRHKVIAASHPSNRSLAGFRNTSPFSRANAFLASVGRKPIKWR